MDRLREIEAEISDLNARLAELDAALIFHLTATDVDGMHFLKSELKRQIQVYEAIRDNAAEPKLCERGRDG